MNFKHFNFLLALVTALVAGHPAAFAQTAVFTYQGRLMDNGNPANGDYGMLFYLCNTPTPGGGAIGNVGIPSVPVTNGLFTVSLGFDQSALAATNLWLEIAVQKNNSPFTILEPRQAITPTPYAITAGSLTGPLPANQLSGALPSGLLSGVYPGVVNFNNVSNGFAGAYSGDGAGLTNLQASNLVGLLPADTVAINGMNTNQGAFLKTDGTNRYWGLDAGALTNLPAGQYFTGSLCGPCLPSTPPTSQTPTPPHCSREIPAAAINALGGSSVSAPNQSYLFQTPPFGCNPFYLYSTYPSTFNETNMYNYALLASPNGMLAAAQALGHELAHKGSESQVKTEGS